VYEFDMIIWYIILFLISLPLLTLIISAFIGVPCLPTHKKQAQTLIDLCELKPGMKVVDLGSGHGRLVVLAALRGAEVVGYELNPILVLFSRYLARRFKVADRVQIRWQSLFKADISDADVVTAFLFPKYMTRLGNGLLRNLKPGAKVISYAFPIKDWQPITEKEGISVYQRN